MTMLQEKAIELIKELPDEKVSFVVSYIGEIKGSEANGVNSKTQKAKEALKRIRSKRISVPADTDYNKLYMEALSEKYENIG